MAILEYLTLHVGISASKAIFKIWTKDSPIIQEVGGDLISLITEKIPSFRERREITRQFEAVADEVARKLEPFINAEFKGLSDNEKEAALLAVGEAIDSAAIDLDAILSKDLDPIVIEKLIKDNYDIKKSLLCKEAVDLYSAVLREACNYIVEVAITLPNFTPKILSEILNRNAQLITLTQEVLSRLPESESDSMLEGGGDQSFEIQYRRSISRKLDWLELYGIDLDPANMRYALSVGYITLTTSKNCATDVIDDDFPHDVEDIDKVDDIGADSVTCPPKSGP